MSHSTKKLLTLMQNWESLLSGVISELLSLLQQDFPKGKKWPVINRTLILYPQLGSSLRFPALQHRLRKVRLQSGYNCTFRGIFPKCPLCISWHTLQTNLTHVNVPQCTIVAAQAFFYLNVFSLCSAKDSSTSYCIWEYSRVSWGHNTATHRNH